VCSARTAGDYLPCLIALDARAIVRCGDSVRETTVEDLVRHGPSRGELLTAVVIERTGAGAETRAAYEKLTFSGGCYGIASVAAVVETSADGEVDVVLVAGGATATPQRLSDAVEALVGRPLDESAIDDAAAIAGAQLRGVLDDVLAPASYRRRVLSVLTARALRRCIA
jgi:CO/xanthine dehydrogenase FAD-binding subunit